MWNIEYYESPAGKAPVAEFINSLDAKSRARIARTLDLLEEFGTDLGMPYARHLGKWLWELRIRHGRNSTVSFTSWLPVIPLSYYMGLPRKPGGFSEVT